MISDNFCLSVMTILETLEQGPRNGASTICLNMKSLMLSMLGLVKQGP
jgi:hypothetical protein